MRLLIQRVKHASVAIGGDVCSRIGAGLLVLLGVGCDDTDEDIEYHAGKLVPEISFILKGTFSTVKRDIASADTAGRYINLNCSRLKGLNVPAVIL